MTPPTRPGLSPTEHASRIMRDASLPTATRAAAVRWHLHRGVELPAADLEAVLSLASAEPDDELWALLLELLALEHPDSRAVWNLCRAGLGRYARLAPRQLASVLRPLLDGGVPPADVAASLVSALGHEGAVSVMVWLFAAGKVPDDIEEPLRSRVVQGIVERERSTLVLHLLALCDDATRAALGHSAAYSRYRCLYWAVQDWSYARREDLEREVKRKILDPQEAQVLADFGVGLHSLAETSGEASLALESPGFRKALAPLGEATLERLPFELAPETLFTPAQRQAGGGRPRP